MDDDQTPVSCDDFSVLIEDGTKVFIAKWTGCLDISDRYVRGSTLVATQGNVLFKSYDVSLMLKRH